MKNIKKTEPNVLDRLFNIAVSDKEGKRMLIKQAEPMPAVCLALDDTSRSPLSEKAARLRIAADLTAWLHASGLTGRGTKRLVDKVTARVMKGYGPQLRRLLHRAAKDAEESMNQREADGLKARLRAGQLAVRGEEKPLWWYRMGKWRGERLASEVQQKRR